MSVALTATAIKAAARKLGFDACGIAPAADHAELRVFREWLDRGYAGNMTYLHRSARRRADVRAALPSARTVIATATVYNSSRPYSTECADRGRAHIARYAWGEDYHDVLGKRLDALLAWMRDASSEPFEALAYVDTGPVQERVYAQHAGLGWIGKNTCLINPDVGSWILLAEIICSLPLAIDEPAFDRCGTCTLCIEACPTQAIVAPHEVDATRCIAYLTIEYRGEIPAHLRPAIGTRVFGCDVCQDVCPWNHAAPESADPAWQPRPAWDARSVAELEQASDDDLQAALGGSAIARTRLAGLRRNLAVARGNVP